MACISTIDIQTRLDVHELLSHFSHFLDHDRGTCWADLFTTDGVFECDGGHHLQGRAELATVPSLVSQAGSGAWRHLITAVVIERCSARKELAVHAYCPVVDMNGTSPLSTFYDLDFTLHFASRWRISHALATRIGVSTNADIGAAAFARGALFPMALQ